jgi:hypothetical protein
MNNQDHISESLETIFWVTILQFFSADPESGMKKIRIRDPDKHPDPQHCFFTFYFIENRRKTPDFLQGEPASAILAG